MNSYSDRLIRAEHYLRHGEFDICTMLCGKEMESLLKDILESYLSIADERQSAEVRGFLTAHRKTLWEKLTAGEIVTLCLKYKVLELLAKRLGLDLNAGGLPNLREMVDLRNKAAHTYGQNEIQEKTDAYVMYGSLLRLDGLAKSLLLETERSNKENSRRAFIQPERPAVATRRRVVLENHIVKTVSQSTKNLALFRNKASGKHFIYLEDESPNKILLVTPDGLIKGLKVNLFDEPTDTKEEVAIDRQLVSREQVRKFHDYVIDLPDRDRPTIKKIFTPDKISKPTPIIGSNIFTLQDLALRTNLSKNKPKKIWINGQEIETKDWSDLCVEMVKWLSDNGYLTINHLPIYNSAGRNKYFINFKPKHEDPKKDGAWKQVKQIFIDTKYDAPHHVQNIMHLLKQINADKLKIQILI